MSKIHPETRTYPLQRKFGCKSTIIILIMQIIVIFLKNYIQITLYCKLPTIYILGCAIPGGQHKHTAKKQ